MERQFLDMEQQSGFPASRSCLDNTFVPQQLVERKIVRNMMTHLMHIDLETAYDNVQINKFLNVLYASEKGKTYTRTLENMYKH